MASRITLSADGQHPGCGTRFQLTIIQEEVTAAYLLTIQPCCPIFTISARHTLLKPLNMTLMLMNWYYRCINLYMCTYRIPFGSQSPRSSFGTNFTLIKRQIRNFILKESYILRGTTQKFWLTISPLGPLNPCGPFSPTSPCRHQIRHTHSYSLMGPTIHTGFELPIRVALVVSVKQTRNDSLACQWRLRCRACLWSRAGPADKQRRLRSNKKLTHTFKNLYRDKEGETGGKEAYSVAYRSHWAL